MRDDPDQVRRSKRFAGARLFSRWYSGLKGGKHVVVVVVSSDPDGRHWIITACIARRLGGGEPEWAKLSFKYDRETDILHIDKCPPYPEQESEELGDEVIARLNPATGEIENVELLFFSTRLLRDNLFELPVSAELHIATAD